ncbi:MAG TPA: TRAP transporter small permease [Dehalococcoidia bacterium]|nr:TRAP transporter small permease [Dehalococcoidia bacterium]
MKVIYKISQISMWVTMLSSIVLMLLTVADVVGRYVFTRPITGTTEITEMLMICTLLAMMSATLAGMQINVDVFTSKMAQKKRAKFDFSTLLVGLFLIVILAWQSFNHSLYILSYGISSSRLEIPQFPFHIIVVISYVLLAISIAFVMWQKIGEMIKK